MSRRTYITIAFVLAILATIVGWSQSMLYKVIPEVPLCLWFPLVVVAARDTISAVVLSVVQFPIFAVAFSLGLRRWSALRVILVLTVAYVVLAGVAIAIDLSHSR